jgi:hypothetical protein
VYFSTLQIDGQEVPVVLGSATMAELHKQVGDTVEVAANRTKATLLVVGTATMASIGIGGTTHLERGNGALLDYELIPPAARDLYRVPPGPNAILVRDKPGVNTKAAVASLGAIVTRLGLQSNGAAVVGVQRPAEIINYGSLGATRRCSGRRWPSAR